MTGGTQDEEASRLGVRRAREESIQSVIEALSVALDRPVLLDDEALSPLAYSAQWGGIDRVRSDSIFSRSVSAAVRDALVAQGIPHATDLVRTEHAPELEMAERVCLPVRAAGALLGYIWILDPDGTLTADQLDRVRATARSLAQLLGHTVGRHVPDEGELLAGLCSSAPAERERALARVRAGHRLPENGIVMCLMATDVQDLDSVAVAARVARRLSSGHAIAGSAVEGAALVVAMGDPVLRPLHVDEVAAWVRAVAHAEVSVGQSHVGTLASLLDAAHQAAVALRIARSGTPGGGSAAWPTLGADRLVAQLPARSLGDLPDGLVRLLREEKELASTLARFLDSGADIKATAAALSLHRSGLYYRLRRIEELTGLHLESGDDRLLAHLAVRAARLN